MPTCFTAGSESDIQNSIQKRYRGESKRIRAEQGKKDEAIELLKKEKRFMAERLSVEAFWGHIEVMGRIVRSLYELEPYV